MKTESSESAEKELHKNLSENWLKNLWSFHSLVVDLYPNGLWGSSQNNVSNVKPSQEVVSEQLPSANGKAAICKLDDSENVISLKLNLIRQVDILWGPDARLLNNMWIKAARSAELINQRGTSIIVGKTSFSHSTIQTTTCKMPKNVSHL